MERHAAFWGLGVHKEATEEDMCSEGINGHVNFQNTAQQ